jgi:hypothetical protein
VQGNGGFAERRSDRCNLTTVGNFARDCKTLVRGFDLLETAAAVEDDPAARIPPSDSQ